MGGAAVAAVWLHAWRRSSRRTGTVMMNSGHRRLAVVVGLLAVAALAGCREQEQGRPLTYEKGVYHGQQDDALSEDTLDALRLRAQRQSYN